MKKKNRIGLYSLIIYIILFMVLSLVGFYPIYGQDKSFVWTIDSAGQYFPAFVYTGNYLQRFFTGLFSGKVILPGYDLSIGMGESIIGTLNYYGFGDPINLISLLINKDNAAGLFAASYFIRMFLAGLAFMYFLSFFGIDERIKPLGAICYIFSGFAISGCLMYISWGSALIVLPMALSGIEKIIKNKKNFWTLLLSVTYGALCGFYFLYMVALSLVFYCLLRFVFIYYKSPKAACCVICNCIYSAMIFALGIVPALFFFYPSVKAFLSSERNSSAFDIIFNYHYYVPHISDFVSFIKGSLIPSLYDFRFGITVIEWLMIIAYFFFANTKRRVQVKIAVLVALIFASIKITGFAFNAFSETNDRYAFLIHFLAAFVFCDALKYIAEKNLLNKCVYIGVCCLLIANIVFNMRYLFGNDGLSWNSEFVARSDVNKVLYSPVGDFDEIEEDYKNGEVFRVATDHFSIANDRPENVAMINSYYGMTYWFSIVNGRVQQYVDDYNNDKMIWRSFGINNDPYAMALAGCKYYVNKVDNSYVCDENSLYKGFAYVCNKDSLEKIEQSETDFGKRSRKLYDIADYSGVFDEIYDNEKCYFECKVTLDEKSADKNVLITALAYDDGWKVKINEKKVKIIPVQMFCAVNLEEGDNIIKFYR